MSSSKTASPTHRASAGPPSTGTPSPPAEPRSNRVFRYRMIFVGGVYFNCSSTTCGAVFLPRPGTDQRSLRSLRVTLSGAVSQPTISMADPNRSHQPRRRCRLPRRSNTIPSRPVQVTDRALDIDGDPFNVEHGRPVALGSCPQYLCLRSTLSFPLDLTVDQDRHVEDRLVGGRQHG